MLTFEVETREQAVGILDHIRLIQYAESLGGVESLMTYPVTQTHADVPEELRLRNGLTDCILRLSVGIEAVEDLIQDLVFQGKHLVFANLKPEYEDITVTATSPSKTFNIAGLQVSNILSRTKN